LRKTPFFFLLSCALVCGSVAPVGARTPSTRSQLSAAEKRAADNAAKLNALRASDQQISAAVKALDAQVNAQTSVTRAAESAVAAANVALTQAQARLDATGRRIARLRSDVAKRAVRAYMRPGGDGVLEVFRSRTFDEASRRQTLLNHVANTDRDLLDELHAAVEDQTIQRTAFDNAQRLAQSRKRAAQDKLDALVRARTVQRRLKAQLDARRREYEQEDREISRLRGFLTAKIRADDARLATSGPRVADPGPVGKVSGAGLIWPVRGPVTSGFGMRWGRMHEGIDISAATGTPIRAAKAGTVTFAGTMGGYGNAVIISHGGGLSTLYAHQSRLAVSGGSVSQGEVIGYVGSTGHSTGPHLHFETRVNGTPQNPLRYLP
jgi:murein DD-endopeptidase MepM/ murein hydrolase activator NlpD